MVGEGGNVVCNVGQNQWAVGNLPVSIGHSKSSGQEIILVNKKAFRYISSEKYIRFMEKSNEVGRLLGDMLKHPRKYGIKQ